jgi:hypothetical protein
MSDDLGNRGEGIQFPALAADLQSALRILAASVVDLISQVYTSRYRGCLSLALVAI